MDNIDNEIDTFSDILKYQQPYSITCYDNVHNTALRERLIEREHRRQKYTAMSKLKETLE